jgi:AcrR family transcriptional regulator
MAKILTPRQTQIALASAPVFFAKGFAATTMGEVAKAAGLSRQGLYLAFADKAQVFDAIVRMLNDQLMAQIELGVWQFATVPERISYACENWLAVTHQLTLAAPAARDLDDLTVPVTREAYDRFVALIARLLEDVADTGASSEERHDLATILVFAIRGFNPIAPDSATLRRMAAKQIDLVIAGLGGR